MTDTTDEPTFSRRNVVLAGLGTTLAAVLAACGRGGGSTTNPAAQGTPATTSTTPAPPQTTPAPGVVPSTILAPTPECADDDVTPAQTEGPFFKPNSPERTNIRGDAGGTKLLLTGTVVTTACKPVARALVEFWQTDGNGAYDNAGFSFRGHQFTDAQGRYQLEAVVPGLYPGRTRHVHVKVQAPGGRALTTQLYFPGEARNASDGIYRKECEVTMSDAADGRLAAFTFVLNG
ncbi:MAG: dioxygenase [Acidimicrobiales bacterium]